jgi:hypothetical protein
MILFELVLWLGVVGCTLLLVASAVASLLGLNEPPVGPPRGARQRRGNHGRRASDSLPVVLFPCHDQVIGEVSGIRQSNIPSGDDRTKKRRKTLSKDQHQRVEQSGHQATIGKSL